GRRPVLRHLLYRPRPRTHRLARDAMPTRHLRLGGIELPALEQNAIGDRDFADIVAESSAVGCREMALVQTERFSERCPVMGEPLAVATRRGVARFDGRAKPKDNRLSRLELIRVPLEPDERSHARPQLSRIEWFQDKVVGSAFNCFQPLPRVALR